MAFSDRASGCQGTGSLRALFVCLKQLFQLGVPVNTFRDLSKEQATTVAAKQSAGLVTAHGSFEAF